MRASCIKRRSFSVWKGNSKSAHRLWRRKEPNIKSGLQRRDEFINKAEGSLVALYAKIKPDAAAAQLADIDEEAAAALLIETQPQKRQRHPRPNG